MSAYIVSDDTISVIVKGFEKYGVVYKAENYKPEPSAIIFRQEKNNAIGQSLLEYNYRSVNVRYNRNDHPHEYVFKDIEIDEGMLFGCINCFIYQSCEIPLFYHSVIYSVLNQLRYSMAVSLIKEKGLEIPWGID